MKSRSSRRLNVFKCFLGFLFSPLLNFYDTALAAGDIYWTSVAFLENSLAYPQDPSLQGSLVLTSSDDIPPYYYITAKYNNSNTPITSSTLTLNHILVDTVQYIVFVGAASDDSVYNNTASLNKIIINGATLINPYGSNELAMFLNQASNTFFGALVTKSDLNGNEVQVVDSSFTGNTNMAGGVRCQNGSLTANVVLQNNKVTISNTTFNIYFGDDERGERSEVELAGAFSRRSNNNSNDNNYSISLSNNKIILNNCLFLPSRDQDIAEIIAFGARAITYDNYSDTHTFSSNTLEVHGTSVFDSAFFYGAGDAKNLSESIASTASNNKVILDGATFKRHSIVTGAYLDGTGAQNVMNNNQVDIQKAVFIHDQTPSYIIAAKTYQDSAIVQNNSINIMGSPSLVDLSGAYLVGACWGNNLDSALGHKLLNATNNQLNVCTDGQINALGVYLFNVIDFNFQVGSPSLHLKTGLKLNKEVRVQVSHLQNYSQTNGELIATLIEADGGISYYNAYNSSTNTTIKTKNGKLLLIAGEDSEPVIKDFEASSYQFPLDNEHLLPLATPKTNILTNNTYTITSDEQIPRYLEDLCVMTTKYYNNQAASNAVLNLNGAASYLDTTYPVIFSGAVTNEYDATNNLISVKDAGITFTFLGRGSFASNYILGAANLWGNLINNAATISNSVIYGDFFCNRRAFKHTRSFKS